MDIITYSIDVWKLGDLAITREEADEIANSLLDILEEKFPEFDSAIQWEWRENKDDK